MKRTLAIICAAFALSSCINKCIIEGNHGGLIGEGWVYLYDVWNDHQVVDSARYNNGYYRFETTVTEPTLVSMYADTQIKMHEFILDPGKIAFASHGGYGQNMTASGTPMNDAFMQLMTEINNLNPSPEALAENFEAGAEILRKELSKGKGDAYRLMVIEQAASGLHPLEVLGYFESLEGYLKAKPYAQRLKAELERRAPVYPFIEGSGIEPHYIDINHPDIDGNNISLKEVVENSKNKFVLVDFWATWCGPCRMYLPMLKDTYEEYHEKGLEVYSVSCDSSSKQWKDFIAAENLDWINVIGGQELPEWKSYILSGIPTTILIDCSTGLIVGRDLHGNMLSKRLEELL